MEIKLDKFYKLISFLSLQQTIDLHIARVKEQVALSRKSLKRLTAISTVELLHKPIEIVMNFISKAHRRS